MVRGVLPILLLLGFAAETTAQTLYPRIISVRTRNNEDWCELETESCVNTEQAVSCYKSKAMPVPIPVPIGGRLYLRLHATHNSAASVIAHNIENLMYGYPGEKDKTTFFGQGGLFSFAPSLSHAGNTYEVCAETTATRISVSEKLYTCIKLEVRTHRVQFVAPTPAHASSFTTTVGRHFEIPLHADTLIPGGCNSSNYTYQCANTRNGISCPVIRNDSSCDFNSCPLQITSSNSFQCSGCTCMTECPLGPLPRVRTRPDLSYPLSNNGLPDKGSLSLAKTLPNGTDVTSDTRAQPWVFSWRPSYSQRSHVPSKICFEAWADMGIKLAEENSETRCYSILVSKCRQCVQTGDTLQSIALQHNTDWLHIYHANPSLPGSNPSHVKSGYVLRLGVQYDTRWGDNMQILSERFLVPQSTLLDQNPELISATTVAYSQEEVPGEYTQISLLLRPRRRVLPGEHITVPLEVIGGEDWNGPISETCEAPTSELELRRYCSPETHGVDDKCGPGLWGRCKYDEMGIMGCQRYNCNGRGKHPVFHNASFDKDTKSLTLEVSARIEAGQDVKVVIPQSAGLWMPLNTRPPTKVESLMQVQETIWNPVLEAYIPMKICVVLPVCHSGVQCLYGTDCRLADDPVASNLDHEGISHHTSYGNG